jgi:hypothetical protein
VKYNSAESSLDDFLTVMNSIKNWHETYMGMAERDSTYAKTLLKSIENVDKPIQPNIRYKKIFYSHHIKNLEQMGYIVIFSTTGSYAVTIVDFMLTELGYNVYKFYQI